jgi:uncharacterized protein YkwD
MCEPDDVKYMLKLMTKLNIVQHIILLAVTVLFCIYNIQVVFANEVQDTDNLINTANVIGFVNKERMERGMDVLTESELLDKVAQKKLEDMINNDYFAHISPEGIDPWQWFFDAGYDFAYAGENLATEYTDVIDQHNAWMNSPKHRKNILDERFTHTGVAVGKKVVNGKEVIITVQVFATPQKISITSPNYTPETFEVPDAIFYKGTKDISEVDANLLNSTNTTILQAGSKNKNSLSDLNNNNKQMIAWAIVGLITIAVVILEYRIFARKRIK